MRDPLTNLLLAGAVLAIGTVPFWGPSLIARLVDRWIWGRRG